ncbi:ABC transporter ATP-binding protein [Bifidobacterium mellis]|uniref:ABC transporter, permease/ATP binding protein, putative The Fe3+-Yersiniabactin uptake transporter n=1 Tax=Bifidobacterium mellis TaxID=1293823 RepID=A0A0F4KW99_9BIFI|nr:ABC transporter ATP-binding protein [Bifidobacterium mellis]KJY50299.1 ABC transporter, permease/ATP binding protein, putative The Fe3+-Yersiniabactin uptake transporter [Bifidobacterium mellis]
MTTDQADSGSKSDPAEGKAQGGGGAPNRERSHGRSSLRRLLDFAGPRKVFSYLGCGLSALSTIAGLGPYICIWLAVKDLLAVAPKWSQATGIAIYGWAGLGFAAASVMLYCAGLLMTHLAAFRSASNMRKEAVSHLMSLPLGYFDLHASGELRRTIDGSAGDTENLLAHILPDAAGSFAMILSMPILMLIFDWRMGLACLFPILIALVCIRVMMNDQGQSFMKEYQDALVRMSKTGTEYVRGIPVVKVFQQTVYSFKAFHEAIEHYSRIARNYAMKICHLPQTIQMTALNGTVVFLVPVAILLAPGQSDFTSFLTDFAFYAVFSGMVPTAMTRLQFSSESFSKADDALNRITGVLSIDPLTVAAQPKHPKSADVSLDQVSYTYPGANRPALDRIDFKVPEGGMVALVGPSGGGKSTCASLLPRFWDVDSGRVAMGGIDVRSIDPHDLMGQVAFVFQTNRLFSTTLLENVRAARPDAAPEQVMEALRAAQCMDIVDKLPEGLDTMLGSGGTYLSGGEVQRVALARAILKESPIVVLDEATAFADPENEFLIQKALTKLTRAEGGRRRTVLMIAHRLSTVAHVDRILVLDGGHLVEQGPHRQLLDAQGTYARIWSDYERAVSWKVDNSPKAAAGAGQNPAGPIAGEKHVVPGVGPFATDSSTGDSDIQRKGGEA